MRVSIIEHREKLSVSGVWSPRVLLAIRYHYDYVK